MAKRKPLIVAENTSLVRDPDSKSIINIDTRSYNKVRERRRAAQRKEEEITSLKGEISDLRSKYDQLVKMVETLGNK